MASMMLLFLSALLLATSAAATDFGYIPGSKTAPENWGKLDVWWSLCGARGTIQSPIQIPLEQNNFPLGPLMINYPYTISKPATFVTDPHHGKVELDASWGTLEINEVEYYTANLHFHSPSEHTVGNIRYPLEMHIVHKTADGQRIAVLGILFEVGAEDNKFLDQFFNYLPLFENDPKASVPLDGITATDLSISLESSYWRYTGSLTTPPCTEGVVWTLLKDVATVSTAQLDSYRAVWPIPNNRPVQPLNGLCKYKPWRHAVFQVTQADYDSCKFSNCNASSCNGTPVFSDNFAGNRTFTFEEEGDHWFICPVGLHCALGMKFKATVKPLPTCGTCF